MAEISKPDYRYIWASGGANVLPSTVKLQTGWTSEVPPYQWENALQNRQDNMLVHINQHGLPQWDALTEYFANKSYTLGSDGLIYKAVQSSGPNTTTQDPTTDTLDTYWTIAFASPGAFITQAQGDVRYLQVLNNGSDINNAATFRTNIGVVDSATATAYAPGYLYGFTLTNNSVSPNTTIDVGSGAARDSLDSNNIKLTSTLRGILQASGSWVAGDNQNKLDTGVRANNSTYYIFVIRKTSDGSADILFSLSATAPAVPSGYSGFRRIGRVRTNASGNIRQFKCTGLRVDWVTPIVEAAVTSPAQGSTLITLTGLDGAPAISHLNGAIYGDGVVLRIVPTAVDDPTIGSSFANYQGGVIGDTGGTTADAGSGEFNVSSDSSGQVRVRYQVTSGNLNYKIVSFGYTEIL